MSIARRLSSSFAATVLGSALASCSPAVPDAVDDAPRANDGNSCDNTDQLAIYERRIAPFVSGDVPNSCSQCHLAGVGLASYVQDTPCQTMACLMNQGEVTLAAPADSPILERILRAEPQSSLITAEVIQQEHDGFLEWITWSSGCNTSVCGVIDDPCNTGTGQQPPPSVDWPLGSCDEAAIVQSFDTKVFSWRGRCSSCHAAYGANTELGPDAPDWIFGAQESPANPEDARNTMYNVIGRGLLDQTSPTQSLLLLKPLNIEPHGGGAKLENTDEQTYKDFLSWIEEYAACSTGAPPPPPQDDPPVVVITHPGDGETRPADVPIPFICTANDSQDGALGATVVWRSDQLPDPFGAGCEEFVAPLAAGTHVITASTTDNDGNTASNTIVLTIE